MRLNDLLSLFGFFRPRVIGGGIGQHTHAGGASGGNTLQHIPPGAIVAFAFGSDPTGFLECNGQNVSRSVYAALFDAIGTTWGAGDGSTTFAVPDLRRRAMIGKGGTGTATIGNAVGNTGGAETHSLTIAENAQHAHDIARGNNTGSFGGALHHAGTILGTDMGTQSSGSGTAHNNMPPAAVIGFYIKT